MIHEDDIDFPHTGDFPVWKDTVTGEEFEFRVLHHGARIEAATLLTFPSDPYVELGSDFNTFVFRTPEELDAFILMMIETRHNARSYDRYKVDWPQQRLFSERTR